MSTAEAGSWPFGLKDKLSQYGSLKHSATLDPTLECRRLSHGGTYGMRICAPSSGLPILGYAVEAIHSLVTLSRDVAPATRFSA